MEIWANQLYDLFDFILKVSNIKGDKNGMIQSDCADNCPTTCSTWESFESVDDPWTVDPSLRVTCGGK